MSDPNFSQSSQVAALKKMSCYFNNSSKAIRSLFRFFVENRSLAAISYLQILVVPCLSFAFGHDFREPVDFLLILVDFFNIMYLKCLTEMFNIMLNLK